MRKSELISIQYLLRPLAFLDGYQWMESTFFKFSYMSEKNLLKNVYFKLRIVDKNKKFKEKYFIDENKDRY